MKKVAILCLLLLSALSVKAQLYWTDSLLTLVDGNTLTLKEKIGAYFMITESYSPFDMEKTYIYGMKGLELAQKANDKRMVCAFYRYIASTYTYTARYDTAHIYQQIQIDIAEEIEDYDLLLQSYYCLANLYMREGKFVQAIENYLKTMSYFPKATVNNAGTVEVLANLELAHRYFSAQRAYLFCLASAGECYRRLKNYNQALIYLTKAKEYMEAMEIDLGTTGQSHIYRELGYVYFAQGDIDKALEYQLKTLHEVGVMGQVTISDSKEALIKIYIAKGEYSEALKHAHDCLELAASLGDPFIDVLAWNSFAEIYRAQGLYAECESAAMKAWNIDSVSVDTAPISAMNIAYANIYLGNKEKAACFFRKSLEFNEQKSNKNYQEAMASMEVQYETEKKETRIAVLEEERKLYIGLGAAIVVALLLGIGLLFYRHRSTVQKRKMAEQQIKQLEQEKELIATRATLDAEKAEREIVARDLHDGVGAMLSVVKNNMDIIRSYSALAEREKDYLDKVSDGLDKSITELRRVAHHIMPAVLVDKGLFVALDDFCRAIPEVEFHCAKSGCRFDPEKELVLYRCAYELVNNSLRHSSASHIDVHLNVDDMMIYLSIVDDGCGFDPETVSMGMGINNMRSRLSVFGGRIDIYSKQGEGTEVNIELDL